ncbi:unnamed protein product [Danaus chrysippus]|uniref:(African queen) hypothetical protein n=1 Tax=Danaus chrysippus TaxID=151541 RepID=A0A8J2W0N5_9NEOP|nr:unnamed protein product [Danaus chrysippus]
MNLPKPLMRPPLKAVRPQMVAILFLFVTWSTYCTGCDLDTAVYKVTVKFLWSETNFPKDYPLNQPKAQWSPLFGQSHNSSYHLYHVGDVASEAMRNFALFGKPEELLNQGDGDERVYDQFLAPAVGDGTGETGNIVFLEGKYSLISVACRLIPSPDWFIGVDSLELCVDSSWVDQITLDLEPLDVGAASGLSFTAPHWESFEPVSKHRPQQPNHPSAAFYYPDLRELPPIAKIEFLKIKEYSIREQNDMIREELLNNIKMKEKSMNSPRRKVNLVENYVRDYTTRNYADLKDLEEDEVAHPVSKQDDNNVIVVTKSPFIENSKDYGDLSSNDDLVLAVANGRRLGLGRHLPRHFRSRLHHAVNKLQPQDCLVSDWGSWSSCSVTCGVGDQYRSRYVIRKNTKDGRECPPLADVRRCKSFNSCTRGDGY